jgi:acetyl esterase/lipase
MPRVCFALLLLLSGLLANAPACAQGWEPPAGHVQRPIWPAAAPNAVPGAKPESVVPRTGRESWISANDVSEPTMTVYAAKEPQTDAAVVVFPGGGFKMLAMDLEGTEICDWLSSRGITCVLLKYRVPKSNHHWDEGCQCHVTPKVLRALQDAQRTIKLVRAQAKALNIDPHKIGVIGFSAGGYLVVQTSNIFKSAYSPVDALDEISSRPDFAIALYPGHLCRADAKLDPSIHVRPQTPPTFLLQAWDDPVDDICNSTVYARALDQAGVPAEVHLFAKGGHAFGLRDKTHPLAIWPSLVERWLRDTGVLP